jgi:hypothetical protein
MLAVESTALASLSPARGGRSSLLKAGACLTMAATTTKPAYTAPSARWKDEENERNLRKLFFAAAADIPDQMLSNLSQPLVRITLKLLELLRAHRAAHAAGGAYVPPDDAAQDTWMQTDSDLVEVVEELDAEFNTQYVKDKIDATTGAGAAERAVKRARKKYTLLRTINTIMRDGLLEAVKDKTLLSHIKNKEYVQTEIDALNKFPASYATRIILGLRRWGFAEPQSPNRAQKANSRR